MTLRCQGTRYILAAQMKSTGARCDLKNCLEWLWQSRIHFIAKVAEGGGRSSGTRSYMP